MDISNNDNQSDTNTKESNYLTLKKDKTKSFSILTNKAYQDACKKEFEHPRDLQLISEEISSAETRINSVRPTNKFFKQPSIHTDSSTIFENLNSDNMSTELLKSDCKNKNQNHIEKGITDLSCTVFEKSFSMQHSSISPPLFIEDGLKKRCSDSLSEENILHSSEPIPPDFNILNPKKRINIQSLLCSEKITGFDISNQLYIRIGMSKYITISDFIDHSELLSISLTDPFREMYLRDCQNGRLPFSKEIYDGYNRYGSLEKSIHHQYSKKLYSQVNCLMRNDISKYLFRNQITKNGNRIENSRKVLSKIIASTLKHIVMMAHCLNKHSVINSHKRIIYRGDNISNRLFSSYFKGNEILEGSFLSTSSSLSLAAGFIASYNTNDNPVLFVIDSKSDIPASSFSSISSDNEFIVRPGSKFLVQDVKKSHTNMYQPFFTINLKEI